MLTHCYGLNVKWTSQAHVLEHLVLHQSGGGCGTFRKRGFIGESRSLGGRFLRLTAWPHFLSDLWFLSPNMWGGEESQLHISASCHHAIPVIMAKTKPYYLQLLVWVWSKSGKFQWTGKTVYLENRHFQSLKDQRSWTRLAWHSHWAMNGWGQSKNHQLPKAM